MFLQNQYEKLPMYNNYNMFFTGKIQIGSQNEEFKVIFDTGSTVIFINSEYCNTPGCESGNRYDNEQSQTHIDTLKNYYTAFGSGILTGAVSKDNFKVGELEVKNVEFIEITDQYGDAFESDFQGLVGLSFPNDGEITLFDYMMKQQLIDKNQFSFHLNRQGQTEQSSITFGGYDKDLIDGEVNWHQVKEKFFWAIEAQQILVGPKGQEEDTEICTPKYPCKLVIDSGTSLITGPLQDLEILYEYLGYYMPIDSDQQQESSCQDLLDLPQITFVIDGIKYPLASNEYTISLDNDGELGIYDHNIKEKLVDCSPVFMPLDYPEPIGPLWIMGDIFMSKYVSIFDRDTAQVGFGKVKKSHLGSKSFLKTQKKQQQKQNKKIKKNKHQNKKPFKK